MLRAATEFVTDALSPPGSDGDLHLPPGPPHVRTPLGFIRYFREISGDPIAFVQRRYQTYGDIYYAPLMRRHLFALRHPDHVRQVLVTSGTNFQKTETGITARTLRKFLGNGLLTSNGEFWRRQRRLVNPALRRRAIGRYADVIVEHTQEQLGRWRDGERIDLSEAMMRLTLRIVARTLFDHDVRGDADHVGHAMDVFRTSMSKPIFLPEWLPLSFIQEAKAARETLDDIVYGLIDARREMPREALESSDDLLSALVLASGGDSDDADEGADGSDGGMTRKQLRDEILTLFLAGHETTSHALTWTFSLLARNPDVRERLVAQVRDVAGDGPVTREQLADLPLVSAAIDESMRIYPPAPAISRTAIEDTTIGGYDVPAGSEIIIWIYAVHHDARWYPEPREFRPSRFEDGSPEAEARPRGAYLPFGAGQRTCIGKYFALMEARLILANLVKEVAFEPERSEAPGLRVAITLSPKGGLPVVVRR